MEIGLELTWARPTTRADLSPLALSDIAKYVIEWGTAGVALSSLDITDNTATAYTLSQLIEGATYRVRISVVDTLGRVSQLSGFVYGVASELGELPESDTSNLLTDTFNTLATVTLSNKGNTPTDDGAILTCDSTSDVGTIYLYSKATPFTGTEAEQAAEIIAQGISQPASSTPSVQNPELFANSITVENQDALTPHYAGWVQDTNA